MKWFLATVYNAYIAYIVQIANVVDILCVVYIVYIYIYILYVFCILVVIILFVCLTLYTLCVCSTCFHVYHWFKSTRSYIGKMLWYYILYIFSNLHIKNLFHYDCIVQVSCASDLFAKWMKRVALWEKNLVALEVEFCLLHYQVVPQQAGRQGQAEARHGG